MDEVHSQVHSMFPQKSKCSAGRTLYRGAGGDEVMKCPEHPHRFLAPLGKGKWELPHFGCDYPSGGCDCYCGSDCDVKYQGAVTADLSEPGGNP